MDEFSGDVTRYLSRMRAGDPDAKTQLLQLVLAELRLMAARMMRSERTDHTLQPTALVNELYLQMFAGNQMDVRDRRHFFAVAAQAMRRILVDHARAKRSEKRGGKQQRVDLDGVPLITHEDIQRMVELDQALERLEKLDARQCRIVELRYLAGLDEQEIALLLGISERTVKRDWMAARAWLHSELRFKKRQNEDGDEDSGPMVAVKNPRGRPPAASAVAVD
jgi:RNA polymerase sigma-70 factor (ECF subfamily)